MRTFEKISDLQPLVGQELGVSEWMTITQEQINKFAEATGDHQWIHIDPERAKAGPFGTTIAHGFLTLSLLPEMTAKAFRVTETRMGVNYGLNKVRFPSPVPAGSKVRGRFKLIEYIPLEGGAQMTVECTMEREGSDKPVCVAESLARRYA
ncbi:MaoC family dehydratase [Piscinibacter sp. HJYY11]|jgi:acyl dehydratase|uniref:MaoC family dehydratase n=1 Tax=Piscinibacter sp. HJYY11 TaxID=2801333 RepID=UPI00191FF6B3|nr:MaoC family dehydratase [Piscinibacter sp. HJYY11]MBL0730421.1 MaoC family dehydratase [Piscinibacter sp. HJYY11]